MILKIFWKIFGGVKDGHDARTITFSGGESGTRSVTDEGNITGTVEDACPYISHIAQHITLNAETAHLLTPKTVSPRGWHTATDTASPRRSHRYSASETGL